MEQPKIKLELSATDKLAEALGYLAVAAVWVLAIVNYADLPVKVPIHYNGAGHADRFSDRSAILVMPLLATVLFFALTALNKVPDSFMYAVAITKENAAWQYTNATRLLRYLKVSIVVIFGTITFKTIQTATKQADGLGSWFLPVAIALPFIPLFFLAIKSTRTR